MMIKTDYYTLIPYHNLMHIQVLCSWDERIVAEHAKDIRKLIQKYYQNGPWAIIEDGRNWELSTPEAERLLKDLVVSNVAGTLRHHAFVTGPSALIKWQVENIFKDVTYKHRAFQTLSEATVWLAEAGYDITTLSLSKT